MLTDVWPFVRERLAAGASVATARVVVRSDEGRRTGAAMAVAADGTWVGSVGGGCIDGDVLVQALAVARGGDPALVSCSIGGDNRMPWEAGPACSARLAIVLAALPGPDVSDAVEASLTSGPAGTRRVLAVSTSLTPPFDTVLGERPGSYVEWIRPAQRLVIVGATDVAAALVSIARICGLAVTVVEPRPAFARSGQVDADCLDALSTGAWLSAHRLTPDDAVVALTHEPRFDDPMLIAAVTAGCRYVSAIGSRATHSDRVLRLSTQCAAEHIRGPAGLDLGGENASSVAAAIVSELIAAQHGGSGSSLSRGTGAIHRP